MVCISYDQPDKKKRNVQDTANVNEAQDEKMSEVLGTFSYHYTLVHSDPECYFYICLIYI